MSDAEGLPVRWEPFGAVILATIDRPERRDALDYTAVRQLTDHLEDHRAVRPVVLTGAGDVFGAGVDLGISATDREGLRVYTARLSSAVAAYPAPIIAAINGPAVGVSASLALSCDLRVGSLNARFALPQTKLGFAMGPAPIGRLVATIGSAHTADMILGGTEMNAEQSLAMGLLHRVVEGDPVAYALEWATRIAAWPPKTLAEHKRWIRQAATKTDGPGPPATA